MATIKIPTTRTIESPVQTYTSEEVAIILKTTPRTVQRLIQSGRLQAFRLGWAYRVLADDLLTFCRRDNLPHSGEPIGTDEVSEKSSEPMTMPSQDWLPGSNGEIFGAKG